MRKQFLFSGTVAGTVLMSLAAAHATPILDLQIISGGQSVDCNGCITGGGAFTGGATGTFTETSQGNIIFVGTVGSSTLNVTVAEGANFLATPQVILNNAETVSSGGPVTIEATDYGQTLGTDATISSNFSTSSDANGPATGTFETFYSTSNALFGGTSLTGGPQTITGALGQTIGIDGVIPATLGTLSDSIVVSLNQPVGNSFGFTTSITVPEPLTLAMFGSGLIGLGAMARRRRKTS
jgi:hypothetical protein